MWSGLSRAFLKAPLSRRSLHCSFCGRDEHAVARLVAGAAAYICDACIHDCVSVLQQNGGFDMPGPNSRL